MCIRDRMGRFPACLREKKFPYWLLMSSIAPSICLLYTSDAADDLTRVDLVGRRFFQAEDGIRDLVRSRGLGDVYKRQDGTLSRLLKREKISLLALDELHCALD